MSEKEILGRVNPVNEQSEEDLDSLLQNFNETCGEGMPSAEKIAEMSAKHLNLLFPAMNR